MRLASDCTRASGASHATHRRVLQTGRLGVAVQCPTVDDLLWLVEFLGPAFRMCPGASAADYTVEAVVNRELYQRLEATRPPGVLPEAVTFVLDQGALTAPWWPHPRVGQRVVADSAHGVLYVLPEGAPRVLVVGRVGGRLFRGAVMRIVR